MYHGMESNEYENTTRGQRSVKVSGQQFLTDVTTPTNGLSPPDTDMGSHLSNCLIPVSPVSLGGRLKVLSEAFQEHRALKMTVVYAPVVSATTSGAIAMYFRNDVGISTDQVGLRAFTHSASHNEFVETSVWEDAELVIDPEDVTLRYFDEETGDERLETQGIIGVIAGSNLPSGTTFGNLFLRYEYEFFAPELDFAVEDVSNLSNSTFQVDSDTVVDEGSPVMFWVGGTPGPGVGPISSISFSNNDLPSFVIAVTLGPSTSTTPASTDAMWALMKYRTLEDPTERTFMPGQGLWMRFTIADANGLFLAATLFEDLASASTPSTTPGTGPHGQLFWVSDGRPLSPTFNGETAYFQFTGRMVPISD
jgi:hypothetical protein